MVSFEKRKWDLYQYKSRKLLLYGLKNKKIFPYGDELIEKLRNIYYGGIPASIILLSDGMTNGYCYDRALLMSRAFIDEEKYDVNLLYATIDGLRLNPLYKRDDNPLAYDHCIVEIKEKNGKEYIIDTSAGFIYEKDLYWKIEHPKIRKINTKEAIIRFVKEDESIWPEDIERDKYALPAIIPNIESCYGRPNEKYTMLGIEMLQKEIELFKKKIKYDEVVKEVREDMKKIGLIK